MRNFDMIFLSFFFAFRTFIITFAGKINANDGKQLKISGSRGGV